MRPTPGQTWGFLRLPRVLPTPVPISGLSPWLVSLPSGALLARLAGLLWFAFRLAGGLVLGLVRLPWASVGLGLGVRGSDSRQMARLLFNTHISVPYASPFNLTLRRPSQGRSEAWRQPLFPPAGKATSPEFVNHYGSLSFASHRNSLSHAAFMSGRAQAAIRLSLDVDVQA